MKKHDASTDKKKQHISVKSGEPKVSKMESQKSKSDEMADKSEGFGGSPEEHPGIRKKSKEE